MLAPGGLVVDECVRTEFGSYVEECDITGRYALASLADTDYECEHGRLAGDPCPSPTIVVSQAWPNLGLRAGDAVQNWPHRFPCGCFAHEPAPAYINLTPKEPLMLTAAPAPAVLADEPPVFTPEEAAAAYVPKYGYKADGTERKRPAPSRERQQRMQAARQYARVEAEVEADVAMRRAIEAAANLPAPAPTRVAHVTTNTLLDKIVADIDAEIARLQAARDALVGVVA